MIEYKKIEHYVHLLPCACQEHNSSDEGSNSTSGIHPTLYELLNANQGSLKMNPLDVKRRKKILHNVQALKSWVSRDIDFDETKRYEIVKDLNKLARSFRQMAIDVNSFVYLNFIRFYFHSFVLFPKGTTSVT